MSQGGFGEAIALQAPFMQYKGKMGLLLGLLVITGLCLSASSTPLDEKPFLPGISFFRGEQSLYRACVDCLNFLLVAFKKEETS